MEVRCHKCRAGRVALRAFERPAEVGMHQVVSCMICGWEVSRPKPAISMTRTVPQVTRAGGRPAQVMTPCSVTGCEGKYGEDSQWKLCWKHAKPQSGWYHHRRLKGSAPPVITNPGTGEIIRRDPAETYPGWIAYLPITGEIIPACGLGNEERETERHTEEPPAAGLEEAIFASGLQEVARTLGVTTAEVERLLHRANQRSAA